MSLFDTDIKETSPITAQLLRDIINERKVNRDDEYIVRYNKLLQHILNRVKYNIEKEIWAHETSLNAMGIDCPFDDVLLAEINQKIRNGETAKNIAEWINSRGLTPSDSLEKFASFFKKRGFKVTFKTYDYLVSDHRGTDKLINISWKQ